MTGTRRAVELKQRASAFRAPMDEFWDSTGGRWLLRELNPGNADIRLRLRHDDHRPADQVLDRNASARSRATLG